MRSVVLDTETTGLSAPFGHRIVSIALIEIVDQQLTGRFLHKFVNPERDSDSGALKVHGLTTEFLKDKPTFKDIEGEVYAFCQDDLRVAHNAQFDRGFIRAEYERINRLPPMGEWLCTKQVAQKKFGFRADNRLDGLVARFGVRDLRGETGVHGALIDALLLAAVLGPLYGMPNMVDFESEMVKGMLRESGKSSGGQSAATEEKDQAPVGDEAGESGGGTGEGAGGDVGVHHPNEAGTPEPTVTAPGAVDGDSEQRGVT